MYLLLKGLGSAFPVLARYSKGPLFPKSTVQIHATVLTFGLRLGLRLGSGLRRCQMNDKVGRLLRAWFSCPTKSVNHDTRLIFSSATSYDISQMQIAK